MLEKFFDKPKFFVLKINNDITNHKIIFSIIFSILVSSICVLNCSYKSVDNCIISMIINGYYGADNHCIFMNYFFCKLVKYIGFVLPYADGYIFICHALLYIATFWITYIVISNTTDVFKRTILIMTLIIVMLGFTDVDIANSNFTIQAGSIAAVGAISIFSGVKLKKYLPYLIMAIIFFSFGAMIRMSACLLVIPYVLLHTGIILISSKNKETIKRAVILTVIPLIFVVGIYNVDIRISASEKYASAYEYNAARAALVDKPRKNWENIKDELPELTENDYMSIRSHLYGDTERYDAAFFKKINRVSKKDPEFKITYIARSCYQAVKVLLPMREFFSLFLVLLSLFVFLSKSINIWSKVECICAFFGTLIIATWFAYNGRIPFRICIPLLIMCYIIVSAPILNDVACDSSEMRLFSPAFVSLTAVLFGTVLLIETITCPTLSFSLLAKHGADETPFKKNYECNSLYVWDTLTLDWRGYGYFVEQGKLPTKRFIEHNVPQGDYIYGQVFTDEYFDKIGTHNPIRALLERENTFYVAEDVSMMETYLKEHVNSGAYAKKVDTIELPSSDVNIPVWRFEVNQE